MSDSVSETWIVRNEIGEFSFQVCRTGNSDQAWTMKNLILIHGPFELIRIINGIFDGPASIN